MKKNYCRVLLSLLTVLLILPLAACQSEVPPKTITIEKDLAYSDETLKWAEQTILSLVRYAYKGYTGMSEEASIPSKTDAKLQKYAHRICQITATKPIPNEKYRSAIAVLAQDGQGAIDELIAPANGEGRAFEKTRKLYLELTYIFGAEHVSSMVYDGCLSIYDIRYEEKVELYEAYQYDWYQKEADAIAEEKAIFVNGIQKEAFATLLKCSTAMAELLALTPEGIADTFSDEEVLEMIRRLDPSQIDISTKGWELLLSYLPASEANPYCKQLVDTFQQNGDVSRVSAVMNDAVKLWASVLKGLLPADVSALRAGEHEKLLNAVFSRFSEEDWALFMSVTSVSLTNEEYSALAEGKYGEAYLEYAESIGQIDADQLRASVGSENFYQNLLNYLARVCPAISYEVNS